jgi:hypothetical protein
MPAALARSATSWPDLGGGLDGGAAAFALQVGLGGAGRGQGAPAVVVDDLGEMCLLDRNTARRGRAAVPGSSCAPGGGGGCGLRRFCALVLLIRWLMLLDRSLLAGLAGLAQDVLAEVAHTLALVGLGLAHGADVGGHLADHSPCRCRGR